MPSVEKDLWVMLTPDAVGGGLKIQVESMILADYAIVDAMTQLVDGPKAQVRGLAFSAITRTGDTRPDLGFEFILTRDEHTRAWAPLGTGGDPYTIERVKLLASYGGWLVAALFGLLKLAGKL